MCACVFVFFSSVFLFYFWYTTIRDLDLFFSAQSVVAEISSGQEMSTLLEYVTSIIL